MNAAQRIVQPVVRAATAVVNAVVTAVVEVVDTVVQVVTLVVDGVRQVVQGPRHDGGIAPMNAAATSGNGLANFWRQVGQIISFIATLFGWVNVGTANLESHLRTLGWTINTPNNSRIDFVIR